MVLLAGYFFLLPGFILIHDLTDRGLRNGEMPGFAYRWHRAISTPLERWARERVQSGTATGMNINDIQRSLLNEYVRRH